MEPALGGHSPAGSSSSTLRGQIPTTVVELQQEPGVGAGGRREQEPAPPERRREGGARPRRGSRGRGSGGQEGGMESWDYVYKQLEHQGYTKDQAERPDVLNRGQEERASLEREEERRRSQQDCCRREVEEERRRDEEKRRREEEEIRRGLSSMRVAETRTSKAARGARPGRGLEQEQSSAEQSKYSSAVSTRQSFIPFYYGIDHPPK